MRYFLARILQFQFHRAVPGGGIARPAESMLDLRKPSRRRAIEDDAGDGTQLPSLEALTGARDMDATALLDGFAPLKEWLDDQNVRRV